MMTESGPESAQEAVLYMKDGKRKYGRLLESDSAENFHFISNHSEQMEILPIVTIDAIDTHLK